jgi:hypothetical protein
VDGLFERECDRQVDIGPARWRRGFTSRGLEHVGEQFGERRRPRPLGEAREIESTKFQRSLRLGRPMTAAVVLTPALDVDKNLVPGVTPG